MATNTGKDILRTCLSKYGKSNEIDSLICYKYGTKEHIEDYQNGNADAILTERDKKRIKGGVPTVVKCFVKSNIYVGWKSSVGIGNGRYQIDTSILKEFNKKNEQDYEMIITGSRDDEKIYLFREGSGIEKFSENVLGLKKQEEAK